MSRKDLGRIRSPLDALEIEAGRNGAEREKESKVRLELGISERVRDNSLFGRINELKIEFSTWPDPIDGLPERDLQKADVILITHHHKDHCKGVTVNRLKGMDL